MNLIQCPACGRQVSSEAVACPQCGHPIAGKKTQQVTGFAALVVVCGIVASCILMVLLLRSIGSPWIAFGLACLPTAAALAYASLPKQ